MFSERRYGSSCHLLAGSDLQEDNCMDSNGSKASGPVANGRTVNVYIRPKEVLELPLTCSGHKMFTNTHTHIYIYIYIYTHTPDCSQNIDLQSIHKHTRSFTKDCN